MRVLHYSLLADYPVNMRTMLAAAPFRWTDPATWPWMFYVWLAFILAGWMVPLWRWFRTKRAAGWLTADGRIESVEINKPSFSFTTKRGYCVAELGDSCSVAGTLNSGRYKREFPTGQEDNEFVRDLQDKAVVVHYNPGKSSSSAMLESDTTALLQNRSTSPVPDIPSANSVPDWIRPFLNLRLGARGSEIVTSAETFGSKPLSVVAGHGAILP
jgi:hypothetical protein